VCVFPTQNEPERVAIIDHDARYGDHLRAYVNFHRPCLFAETITDAKGRQRKRYELMITSYEKLK
jgi:hypothetical protein